MAITIELVFVFCKSSDSQIDGKADDYDDDDKSNSGGQVRQRWSYGREDRQESTYRGSSESENIYQHKHLFQNLVDWHHNEIINKHIFLHCFLTAALSGVGSSQKFL